VTVTSEEAVRRYLAFLADPAAARDDDRIADLEGRLGETADPIEKIKIASELYRAQNVDGSEYRDGFVAEAKAWAEENGIVSEAFLQLGVPIEDLREAGFEVGRRPRGGERPAVGGRSRAPRVSVEEIRDTALRVSGPFTVSELRALVGGTPATVRKALDGLLEDGRLVDLGPDKDWSGRGRAPHLYRRT
jgi:DNA-binding transcriptional ArsR family regulator